MIRVLVLPPPRLLDAVPKHFSAGGPWVEAISGPAVLSSGVADPDDPTHITFEFFVYRDVEITGVIDAYLQNDDSLVFRLRETPELARLRVELPHTRHSGIDGWPISR